MTLIHLVLVALILLSRIHIVNPQDDDPDPEIQLEPGDDVVDVGDPNFAENGDDDVDADADVTNAKSALFQAQIFHPPVTVEEIEEKLGAELWVSEYDAPCHRQIRIMSSLSIEEVCQCEKHYHDWALIHHKDGGLCPDLNLYVEKLVAQYLDGSKKPGDEIKEASPEKIQHKYVFVAQPEAPPISQNMDQVRKVKEVLDTILNEKKVPYYDMMAYKKLLKETAEDIRKKIARVIRHKVPVNVASVKQGAASRGYIGHEYYNMGDRDNEFEAKYPQVLCLIETDNSNIWLRPVWQPPKQDQKERTVKELQAYFEQACGSSIIDLRKPEFRISPAYAASILPANLLKSPVLHNDTFG